MQCFIISHIAREKAKEQDITIRKCNYKLLRGPNTHVVRYIRLNFLFATASCCSYILHQGEIVIISTRLWHGFTVTLKNWCSWIPAKSNPHSKKEISEDNFIVSVKFRISFEFKLTIKQYYMRRSAVHHVFTQRNKTVMLVSLHCLAVSC